MNKRFCRMLNTYWNCLGEIIVRIKTNVIYKYQCGKMGSKCQIFRPMRLIGAHNLYIGDNVRIYKNSRIETIEAWEGSKYNPRVKIGSGTSFEQGLHLICASKVQIGDYVTVSANVMITDANHKYDEINKYVINQPLEVKDTIIGDYCFIGMGARIMPGTVLGKNCIVGTNSVVSGVYPDFSVIAGIPSKIIKRYDLEKVKWRKTNNKGEFIDEV